MNKFIYKNVLFSLVFFILDSIINGGCCYASENYGSILELCKQFNVTNTMIRDGNIEKSKAKEQVKFLSREITKAYHLAGGKDYQIKDWVFPLKNYGYKAIGGINGNGYQKGRYDYFDGDRHTGHPSQDIFIHDMNQDCQDDKTKLPVRVLSVTGGVVVALENNWDTRSKLRGGKYIWVLDPSTNALLYYAHNNKIYVKIGDLVKPGDVIADVGRTGLNAYKKRSPTHLHLTHLSIVGGLPVPKNIYMELIRNKFK